MLMLILFECRKCTDANSATAKYTDANANSAIVDANFSNADLICRF